jgi:predicted O-methyltransferase YrrM
MKETDDIEDYILGHIDKESDYLQRLYRDTCVNLLRPRMASGHIQGRMLKMFVEMIRPCNILEIGTYSGYSALCMAEGLREDGHLYTFEINDEQEDFTRPWIEGSPYAQKVDFIIGDALDVVPKMNIMFDMAFIDGDKRHYIEYFEMVMKKLNRGGYILADNTLWDGHVLSTPTQSDKQTWGIMNFNDYITDDHRIEKVILPLRDGLTVIRKL